MSIWPRGYGLIGNQVVKTGLTLPASTTGTIFTISGGSILVQFFALLVTTAFGSTATTLTIGNTPTGGTAANASISTTVTVTSKTVGTFIIPTFSANIGGAAVMASIVQAFPGTTNEFVAPAGTITWTTSATDTGACTAYLSYMALDSPATVS